jgi:hypothetical protein
MTYFHPRDFDPEQPLIKELPFVRKLKSYLGLKRAMIRFNKFMERYDFIDIDLAEKRVDWDKVPLIEM